MQFGSQKDLQDLLGVNESRFGVMDVLQQEGLRVVSKYRNHDGYISARQSNRWSKKKMDLLIQGKSW
jgi:hypothetical protein